MDAQPHALKNARMKRRTFIAGLLALCGCRRAAKASARAEVLSATIDLRKFDRVVLLGGRVEVVALQPIRRVPWSVQSKLAIIAELQRIEDELSTQTAESL